MQETLIQAQNNKAQLPVFLGDQQEGLFAAFLLERSETFLDIFGGVHGFLTDFRDDTACLDAFFGSG